jgi:STE24 endopeptidase
MELEGKDSDVPAGHTRTIVTFRPRLWMPIALVATVAWGFAAWALYRTSVPDGLSLPNVAEGDHWTASELGRASDFQLFLTVDYLLATVAVIVALFVLALWAPGFARNTGLGSVGAGIIVGLVTLVVVWAVDVPFRLAEQWWYRRHDLSEESYLAWLFAPWAELASASVLALFLVAVTMALARWIGRLWWLAGAPVFIAVTVFAAFVFPYLDPYPQRPLAGEPGITERIPEIEERTGAGPTEIRVSRVSDSTSLVNAYTAGMGPSERVVLWDTFLNGRFSDEEVVLVLAHELGHVAKSHIWKSLGWFVLFAFPMTLAVAELTRRRGGMGQPGNVPLAALLLVVIGFALAPAQNAVSRNYEEEADWVALGATSDPEAARELFAEFVRADLADPTPSFWEEQLFGTHPSPADRIAMADAWEERGP